MSRKYIELPLIGLVLMIVLAACKSQPEAVEMLSKTGDTYELGAVLPELRSIENDTARIALYPHARWFYLDMRMKGSSNYLALIQAAAESGHQVKVRIFKRPTITGGEEIAQIY